MPHNDISIAVELPSPLPFNEFKVVHFVDLQGGEYFLACQYHLKCNFAQSASCILLPRTESMLTVLEPYTVTSFCRTVGHCRLGHSNFPGSSRCEPLYMKISQLRNELAAKPC
jgi:hypothetical protein